jgi:hypothetical protein
VVVDDNPYTRKLLRMMLINLGAKTIYEAADGMSALDLVRAADPDVMILDWEMLVLTGAEVVRIVRSPSLFPKPNLPIINADRLWPARTGRHRHEGRGQRIPGEAGLPESAPGSAAVDPGKSAADGADRSALCAAAAGLAVQPA